MPLLAWPAPAAGIVAVLAGLDRTERPPGRTPLLHSPPAAALWSLSGWALALAFAPAFSAGTVLAVLCGFCAELALDALEYGELFMWPRTLSPAEWLLAFRPESLVHLGSEAFIAPSADGVVPQSWAAWRVLTLRPQAAEGGVNGRASGILRRHGDLLLSAGSLAALLLAVVLK